MTCTILRPDPQALFNQLQSMFSSTVLGGGAVIPESNEWYVITNDYAMAEQYYAIADQMWRENNPVTACCDNLYKMAAQNGVFPKPAGHAQGYARLTGVPGTAIPLSLEILTGVGTFVSVGTVPLTMPDSAVIVIRIRALVPGSDMNSTGSATTGTLVTPAPGIDTAVQICGGQFCGGADAETCEEFRKRYLERLAYKPRATQAWLMEKLVEFPCATRACVREGSCCRCNAECSECSCKNCGNRMEFYVLFDGVFPCGIPPQHIVDDITTWIFGEHQGYGEGEVEIGICGQIYAPKPFYIDVSIDIQGCPSSSQKQIIADQVRALFLRVCPSLPLRVKQVELIIASVIGAEINAAARFDPVGGGTESGWVEINGAKVWIAQCGDIEPECDVLPCLNEINFVGPDQQKPPC